VNNVNTFGQIVGPEVKNWERPPAIRECATTQKLTGQYCQLVKLEEQHAPILMEAFSSSTDSHWTYLPYGPFNTLSDYQDWVDTLISNWKKTSFPYCILSADGESVLGVSAYLRIMPEAGSIEIGHLSFSPLLQKTAAATEAIFLMINTIFELGYRRCEWKCNSLNAPSIAAAKRLGFKHEGTFRQAQVVKAHNRDTAWFSIIDCEWKSLNPVSKHG